MNDYLRQFAFNSFQITKVLLLKNIWPRADPIGHHDLYRMSINDKHIEAETKWTPFCRHFL